MRKKMTEQIDMLFDFAMSRPDGFTYADVEAEYGWDRHHFYEVVRAFRRAWGPEKAALACAPDGPRSMWKYKLSSDPEHIAQWHNNRLADTDARLETIEAVAKSALAALDQRTAPGKRAAKIFKVVSRLREDLAELG